MVIHTTILCMVCVGLFGHLVYVRYHQLQKITRQPTQNSQQKLSAMIFLMRYLVKILLIFSFGLTL